MLIQIASIAENWIEVNELVERLTLNLEEARKMLTSREIKSQFRQRLVDYEEIKSLASEDDSSFNWLHQAQKMLQMLATVADSSQSSKTFRLGQMILFVLRDERMIRAQVLQLIEYYKNPSHLRPAQVNLELAIVDAFWLDFQKPNRKTVQDTIGKMLKKIGKKRDAKQAFQKLSNNVATVRDVSGAEDLVVENDGTPFLDQTPPETAILQPEEIRLLQDTFEAAIDLDGVQLVVPRRRPRVDPQNHLATVDYFEDDLFNQSDLPMSSTQPNMPMSSEQAQTSDMNGQSSASSQSQSNIALSLANSNGTQDDDDDEKITIESKQISSPDALTGTDFEQRLAVNEKLNKFISPGILQSLGEYLVSIKCKSAQAASSQLRQNLDFFFDLFAQCNELMPYFDLSSSRAHSANIDDAWRLLSDLEASYASLLVHQRQLSNNSTQPLNKTSRRFDQSVLVLQTNVENGKAAGKDIQNDSDNEDDEEEEDEADDTDSNNTIVSAPVFARFNRLTNFNWLLGCKQRVDAPSWFATLAETVRTQVDDVIRLDSQMETASLPETFALQKVTLEKQLFDKSFRSSLQMADTTDFELIETDNEDSDDDYELPESSESSSSGSSDNSTSESDATPADSDQSDSNDTPKAAQSPVNEPVDVDTTLLLDSEDEPFDLFVPFDATAAAAVDEAAADGSEDDLGDDNDEEEDATEDANPELALGNDPDLDDNNNNNANNTVHSKAELQNRALKSILTTIENRFESTKLKMPDVSELSSNEAVGALQQASNLKINKYNQDEIKKLRDAAWHFCRLEVVCHCEKCSFQHQLHVCGRNSKEIRNRARPKGDDQPMDEAAIDQGSRKLSGW